jgi:hypothetical protein
VRSVASLELAAGLPGPDGPEAGVRNLARCRAADATNSNFPRFDIEHPSLGRSRFDGANLRRGVMPSGTADSTQKHIEIVFERMDSSCYPWLSLGAEGIVSSMSRSPN